VADQQQFGTKGAQPMMSVLKSAAIAVFSSLWLVGILGAANRWLMVARIERTPDAQLAAQAARFLEDARRDLIIGGIWLGLVILYWAFRLSRFLDRQAVVAPNQALQPTAAAMSAPPAATARGAAAAAEF
jgi:hypothetical protein